MSWASYIPKELSLNPIPFVVLTGLDIKHNAIHKEIWDGFNSRTNQKFRYALLDGDHEYPKCKNKRPTEVYVPKGILKTNWFHKHLYIIPSLVVVFFELDWDEPNWKEKQMECATKVELVRHSLLDRNTRIILILIQKHPSIPVDGDNSLARERYPALCTACSIKNNYLFLLHAEYLQGYILKLEEEAFTEPTQTYYTLEIKAIKFKRDSLIKVTHQFLFVRLAIKIAFFNEMKQDVFKAIEYYKQAYLSLLDIRFYDTNLLEIKTIAGIINYKLSKLLFEIKHPIDAIDQFRKHIDIFKIKVGQPELSFEHSAWLSKQFQVMGELFENAIEKEYLSAVQTQHPGFYFHSAANHSIQRRINSKEFLNKPLPVRVWTKENPSPIEALNSLEFYGQRPWRQGQQSMEILDQQKEKDGILCLQEIESKENLTPLITNLYKQAITHFKVFNCKRMKQYLSVCMAEEHFYAKDYQESLNIYVKVLNDYNNEHWWPILTSIMFNALRCAFLIADITNYCLLCTEIIGQNILLSDETKSLIQKNLLRVISNQVPFGEYHQIDTSLHSIEEAFLKWQTELNKSQTAQLANLTESQMDTSLILAAHKIIPAQVSGMVPFVECKLQFTSALFNSNENCELMIYMRTNCPDSIQFDKLYIRFNLSNYNQYCIVENRNSLLFEPNKTSNFQFKFLPQKQDIGKDLEVNSVSLELGNRDVRVLVMHWKGDCKNALTHENNTIMAFKKVSKISSNSQSELNWDEISIQPNTSIVARKSNIELKLEHKMPILLDEYYPIKLTIENKEESLIENLSLTAEFLQINSTTDIDSPISIIDKKTVRLWIGEIDKNQSEIQQTKSLSNIEPNQSLTEIIYIQMNDLKCVNLLIQVKYELDVMIKMVSYTNNLTLYKFSNSPPNSANTGELDSHEINKQIIKCSCVQEDKLKLESLNAFKFDFYFMSMQMKPISSVRFGEPFLLLCEIKNLTPYSLVFKNSHLERANLVKFKSSLDEQSENFQSFLKGETLKPNEIATECFCLVIEDDFNHVNRKIESLGEYFIEWRRKSSSSILHNKDQQFDESDESDFDENNKSRITDQSSDLLCVSSKINLPEINVEIFPFIIETKLPSYGWLDQQLALTYTIKNKTISQILEIECSLDENEFFAIAGKKLELMQIMPNDSNDYTFVIYPLQVGFCKLPNFHVKLINQNLKSNQSIDSLVMSGEADQLNENILDSIVRNMLPSQLFIFPEKIEEILKN